MNSANWNGITFTPNGFKFYENSAQKATICSISEGAIKFNLISFHGVEVLKFNIYIVVFISFIWICNWKEIYSSRSFLVGLEIN